MRGHLAAGMVISTPVPLGNVNERFASSIRKTLSISHAAGERTRRSECPSHSVSARLKLTRNDNRKKRTELAAAAVKQCSTRSNYGASVALKPVDHPLCPIRTVRLQTFCIFRPKSRGFPSWVVSAAADCRSALMPARRRSQLELAWSAIGEGGEWRSHFESTQVGFYLFLLF